MADTAAKPSVFLRVTMNQQGTVPTTLATSLRRRPDLARSAEAHSAAAAGA